MLGVPDTNFHRKYKIIIDIVKHLGVKGIDFSQKQL